MYAQELLALAPLCEATRSSVARAVGGEWPDIGYELPRGRPLRPSDASLVLTHAHLTWSPEIPHGDGEVWISTWISEAIYRGWAGRRTIEFPTTTTHMSEAIAAAEAVPALGYGAPAVVGLPRRLWSSAR